MTHTVNMSVILSNLRTVLSIQVFLFFIIIKKKQKKKTTNCHGKYHVLGVEFFFIVRSKMFGLKMSNRATMAAEHDLDERKKLLKPYVLYREMNL